MIITNIKTSKGGNYQTHNQKGGTISTNLWRDTWRVVSDPTEIALIRDIENADKINDIATLTSKLATLNALSSVGVYVARATGTRKSGGVSCGTTSTTTSTSPTSYEELKETCKTNINPQEQEQPQETNTNFYQKVLACFTKLDKFMSEFISEEESILSDRFTDTLLRQKTAKGMSEFIYNYYNLQKHPSCNDIMEKMKSQEFKEIEKDLVDIAKDYNKTDKVNKRLVIYYGPAGTGKTTKAIEQATIKEKVVCSPEMTSTDLVKVFNFESGQPTFEKSILARAIENGDTIVLDEINMLNQNTLKTIQGLTDNSEIVEIDNLQLKVHPNFKIIGTMNLVVNGCDYPLPSPIVDRACEIVRFGGNVEQLASRFALRFEKV